MKHNKSVLTTNSHQKIVSRVHTNMFLINLSHYVISVGLIRVHRLPVTFIKHIGFFLPETNQMKSYITD